MAKLLQPIQRLGIDEQFLLTYVVRPLNVWASGTVYEEPCETFRNWMRIGKEELDTLNTRQMARVDGIAGERTDWRWCIPRWGGWRNYVVLERGDATVGLWYVGWRYPDGTGAVSRVPLWGSLVRMRISSLAIHFFAVNKDGVQGSLHEINRGCTGCYSEMYSQLPMR